MGLDEELENLEDGAQTDAELVDEETEIEDTEEFQDDEEFDPDDGEADLEEAYEGFMGGDDSEGDVEEVVVVGSSDEDDGFEVVELDLDEDDIVRYIEDEDGERIGFVLMEDGEEAEYYYVDDDDVAETSVSDEEENEFDLGITKEGVAQATNDVNAIYKDGIAVAAELKGAFDDIKSAFDFGSILKK